MSSWHHEIFGNGERHSYKIKRELFNYKSAYQQVAIYELSELGTTLVLDSKIQAAEADEYIYHEALVHTGLLAHEHPKSVFIAGGGEGATLREVLRHRSVEHVTMVEIDEAVVKACRIHLRSFHMGSFTDPRLRLHFADARVYLQSCVDTYDAIIVDVSDPEELAPSRMLFTREFYRLCSSRLNKKGVIIVQGDIVGTNRTQLFIPITSTLRGVFANVFPYWAHVPSFHYPWGFVVASTQSDPSQFDYAGDAAVRHRIAGELRYYDSITHKMSSLFTKSVRDGLNSSVSRQLTDAGPLFASEMSSFRIG